MRGLSVANTAVSMGRLPRAQRREQILLAATEAFARAGYAGTSLEDIATQAGVTRVILYRHFESKSDLYQAVLDRFVGILAAHVGERVGEFTDAAIDGLVAAAAAEPAGFRLMFHHAAREPEFRAQADRFRDGMTRAAGLQISALIPHVGWARWASQLAPAVAIEAITAWLDAGRPEPAAAAERVRRVIAGVLAAATQSTMEQAQPPSSSPARRRRTR
jgi:AcrR family transcriptional regulator